MKSKRKTIIERGERWALAGCSFWLERKWRGRKGFHRRRRRENSIGGWGAGGGQKEGNNPLTRNAFRRPGARKKGEGSGWEAKYSVGEKKDKPRRNSVSVVTLSVLCLITKGP